MTSEELDREPFAIKDCALIAIATGKRAQSLRELRDNLVTIHPGSIYYHFWGGLLRPKFDDPEYNNDFAVWVSRSLHDGQLAERLAVIDPTGFDDPEALRRELIDVIEERLDELPWPTWALPDHQFQFIRSEIVVFDTKRRIETPRSLVDVVPAMSGSSVFYHFIDARRRLPDRVDDIRAWLSGLGPEHEGLCALLAGVDPYFVTLPELRQNLTNVFVSYFQEEVDESA